MPDQKEISVTEVIEELRNALAFYANPDNWTSEIPFYKDEIIKSDQILVDNQNTGGKLAREVCAKYDKMKFVDPFDKEDMKAVKVLV